MSGDYTAAFYKDVTRLIKEYEAAAKTLKSKPQDAKALKTVAQVGPHLDQKSLDSRKAHAEKLDAQALQKALKGMGL